MKTPLLFALFPALFFMPAAFGQSPSGGSTTVTATVASQYLFRGVRLAGPSLQPSVEYDRGNAAIGIWACTPLVDKVPGQSDPEIDPYGSYKIVLTDAVNLQPGFTLYTFPRAEPKDGFYRLTFEPNLALNYATHGVVVTPKVYYDVVLRGPTYELSAAYALPVKQIGSEVDFYAAVGTYQWKAALEDASPDVRGRGDYWSASATVPFQISPHGRIIGSVGYARGSNNYFKQASAPKQPNPGAVGRVIATLAYAYSF